MKKIFDKIKEYNTIIIHGHIRPDGDCIGCQYGLMHLIKASFPNKKVYVTGEESEFLNFIGKPCLVDEDVFKDSLAICVDTATESRLSDGRYNKSKYTIKIDHHLKDEVYCDYEYIDEKASSCSEIIVEFYSMFKDELIMDTMSANALYTGMVTDTGNFTHDNVTSKTFFMAGLLLDKGVSLREIHNNLGNETLNILKLKGYCLNNFKITDNGFAYIVLSKDIVKFFDVTDEEASYMVNLISQLKDVPVWALIIENDKEIRVRLRSKGPAINELAQKYNGGGHKMASGAKLNNWEQLPIFILDTDTLVKKYKETLQ